MYYRILIVTNIFPQ
jgi:The ARF-like 2 binding protein BART